MITVQDVKEYYDRYHREKGTNAWRAPDAFTHLLKLANIQPGESVLDVGFGTGYLLQEAAKSGAKVCGQDISEEAVRLASKIVPSANLKVGPGENLQFEDDQFDAVFCIGALEHFMDMEQGMREMERVAKPNARLFIEVPNKNYLGWKFTFHPGTHQQDINERLWTQEEWEAFFSRCGAPVQTVLPDTEYFHQKALRKLKSNNPLSRLMGRFYKGMGKKLPLKYAYQFIFVLLIQE